MRTEGVMEQRQHVALISNSARAFHAGAGFIPIGALPRGAASPVQLSGFFIAIALMLRDKQRGDDSRRRGGPAGRAAFAYRPPRGACDVIRSVQGLRPRRGRGLDRVPAGVLDWTP